MNANLISGLDDIVRYSSIKVTQNVDNEGLRLAVERAKRIRNMY